MRLLVVYHPDFYHGGYPPLKDRVEPAFLYLRKEGCLDRPGVQVLEPEPVQLELVRRVHTERHIEDVGLSGFLEVSLLSTGGVVEASRVVADGEAEHAFCFVGAAGHHASREGFWGFCFINDVATAALDLLNRGLVNRIAVVDIDPHYGDGTRDILGPDPRVLHVNFHSSYGGLGDASGPHNVDFGLPHDCGDDLFMEHADAALDRARDFEPELLFVVFGYDSAIGDYGAFRLSTDAYRRFARAVLERFEAGTCFVLSGGAEVDIGKAASVSVVDVLSS
jgi:acetoin utilization deacetylase AcuC-like enzyme